MGYSFSSNMFLHFLAISFFLTYGLTIPTEQVPLIAEFSDAHTPARLESPVKERELHGRFLHITDFHPDPFYETYSSTEADAACHRGNGPAGIFGAETTDCDSPSSLINATFKWIDDHLKDTVDFVIWTGDSARHDSDLELPRSEKEITRTNEFLIHKFEEVFGTEDDPINDFSIPIIPSFGNNDIMPHNIMDAGPNEWTRRYLSVWRKFIPEEQRHGFSTGGWFYVEVIPNRLAVFSLNTLYFFEHNTMVDGCAERSEPGHQQMEWLRIQLQLIRRRGMKAILMGHVPPARTEAKPLWYETCWQKYTLWLQQYRDVIVGSIYGHMNIDHFLVQDSKDISNKALRGETKPFPRTALDDEMTIQSNADYLTELREDWSRIPDAPKTDSKSILGFGYLNDLFEYITKRRKHKRSEEDKFLEKIGGEWAERYSVSLVSPSIVPNYFPTMRVFEYNITGLDDHQFAHANQLEKTTLRKAKTKPFIQDEEQERQHDEQDEDEDEDEDEDKDEDEDYDEEEEEDEEEAVGTERKRTKKRKDKKNKRKKPKMTIPKPPSKSAPPGPAYSPQTLSLLSYKQYFANLTRINDDFGKDQQVGEEKWHNGKHSGKNPHKDKLKHHNKFKYEVEYDTRTDSVFGLKDLTVRSYVDLAGRIGQYKPQESDRMEVTNSKGSESGDISGNLVARNDHELAASKKKHKKHGKKHKHRKAINKVWFTFVNRAFVGTKDDDELHDDYGQDV